MIDVPSACVHVKSDSQIVLSEKRSSICFLNPSRKSYELVYVDGCAIKEGPRCDYLLRRVEDRLEYFVELKGCDVPHAIEQLRASINLLRSRDSGVDRKAYVISTRGYPRTTTGIQRAVKEFGKRFSTELVFRETPYTCTLP